MMAKKLDAPAANAAPETAAAAVGAGGAGDVVQPCVPAVKTEDTNAGDEAMADSKEVPVCVCMCIERKTDRLTDTHTHIHNDASAEDRSVHCERNV